MDKVRKFLLSLNTKTLGATSLGTAVTSTLAYYANPNAIGAVVREAFPHMHGFTPLIAVLLVCVVLAYFAKPAVISDKVSNVATKSKELLMSSPVGKFIGPILAEALAIAEADKTTLLARLAESNVTVIDLGVTAVENALTSANLGPFGGLLKTEIRSAIEKNKDKLVLLAGTEEDLAFVFIDTQAKAFIAGLEK